MSSSSLFTILENIQESIALAVDMAKNQRENETGESNIPLEFHLKNNHHQSNLAEKNQVKESIHDLQRENENMRKINLTLKKKIIDFEKSNQLLSHHILLTNVRNINKLNQKLSKHSTIFSYRSTFCLTNIIFEQRSVIPKNPKIPKGI